MSAVEPEEWIEERLTLRLDDLAIKVRGTAVIFHTKSRVSKTTSIPISHFAFLGEIKSVDYEELDGDEVEIRVRAKKKAAP